ncbi:homeobox protein [Trichonephila clavipes]|nr:homeobox protein [Trichonephila clavipes]
MERRGVLPENLQKIRWRTSPRDATEPTLRKTPQLPCPLFLQKSPPSFPQSGKISERPSQIRLDPARKGKAYTDLGERDFVGSPDPTTLGGPMGPLGHMVSLGHHHHHHHHHQSPLTQRSGMTADHGAVVTCSTTPHLPDSASDKKKRGLSSIKKKWLWGSRAVYTTGVASFDWALYQNSFRALFMYENRISQTVVTHIGARIIDTAVATPLVDAPFCVQLIINYSTRYSR